MRDHILLERAFKFRYAETGPLNGWQYRRDIGAWVEEFNSDNLMVSTEGAQNPSQPRPVPPQPRPRPISKKADMETGEDMKGP
jgi:hypothetical protein